MTNFVGRIFPLFPCWCALLVVLASSAAAAAAAPSAADSERATKQLFQAVYSDDLSAVEASVREGADVGARDRWGLTPTDIAIDRGYYRIAHFLVSVRNTHRSQNAAAANAGEPAAVLSHPTAAAGGTLTAYAPAKPQASLQASVDSAAAAQANGAAPVRADDKATAAAWPAGKPNPFDPSVPAPGSQFRPIDGTPVAH